MWKAKNAFDRGECVCAGGHRPQATEAGGHLVPNPTDSQPHAFRETSILQALHATDSQSDLYDSNNQLILFDF
jgi:hypothetical protein